jgi:hypothetical protein
VKPSRSKLAPSRSIQSAANNFTDDRYAVKHRRRNASPERARGEVLGEVGRDHEQAM